MRPKVEAACVSPRVFGEEAKQKRTKLAAAGAGGANRPPRHVQGAARRGGASVFINKYRQVKTWQRFNLLI